MKTAILVDGDFYLRRYFEWFGAKASQEPDVVAQAMWVHCMRHLDKNKDELYRILFYDCPPLTKKVHHPVTERAMDLNKTWVARFRTSLHRAIVKKPNVALRLGYLDEKNADWKIKDSQNNRRVISGKMCPTELPENAYIYHATQKGVDMKIGLDIASMAFKKMVQRIILIAGDSDFVPAAKLARREGIIFWLDPMWKPIKADLSEHIDLLKTTLPQRKAKVQEGK